MKKYGLFESILVEEDNKINEDILQIQVLLVPVAVVNLALVQHL